MNLKHSVKLLPKLSYQRVFNFTEKLSYFFFKAASLNKSICNILYIFLDFSGQPDLCAKSHDRVPDGN